MTTSLTLYDGDHAQLVLLVADDTFVVSRGSLTNTREVKIPNVMKSMRLTHMVIKGLVRFPLSSPICLMQGDSMTFSPSAINLTIE